MWVDDPENVGVKVKVPQVQPKAISYTSTSSTGGSGGSRTPSSLESTSSEMTCTAYTTVKTQNSYAALTTVLSHLSRRCPDFIPRNILDFGCGPGSAIWAACDIWPSQVQTAHLVDLAEPFLHIAQRFAKARMQSNDKEIASRVPQKQITYQRFLSQKSMVIIMMSRG